MRIDRVDPYDDPGIEAWHATYRPADDYGRPYPTPWMIEEVRAELRAPQTAGEHALFSGYVDGVVVSCAQVHLPLLDNLQTCELMVFTHPDHRRRGHGTAMLAHVEGFAAERGRTVLQSFGDSPLDGPEDGSGHPDCDFLHRRGWSFEMSNIQRTLDLPVDEEHLRSLADCMSAHHEGYTFRSFHDPCPEDVVASYAALVGTLMTEAPTGGLVVEDQVYDADRVRQDEDVRAAAQRLMYVTVAIGPDDKVVAYTQLVVTRHDPGRVYQWGTLVAGEHRGHRLGVAVKARNHRFLQEHEETLTSVSTYNAGVNDHMIRVNELLGFRPVWRSNEFQKKLA